MKLNTAGELIRQKKYVDELKSELTVLLASKKFTDGLNELSEKIKNEKGCSDDLESTINQARNRLIDYSELLESILEATPVNWPGN